MQKQIHVLKLTVGEQAMHWKKLGVNGIICWKSDINPLMEWGTIPKQHLAFANTLYLNKQIAHEQLFNYYYSNF